MFVNGFFFNHYGFGGGRFAGRGVWTHNPEHRMGVAYPNQRVASRFGGNFAAGNRSANRPSGSSANRENFGGNRFQRSEAPSAARSSQGNAFRSAEPRSSAPHYSAPGSSAPRYSAPGSSAPRYSAPPQSAPHYSAPAQSYRSAPAYNGGSGYRSAQPTYRSAAPTYHSAAPTYRSAPSGGSSGFHSAPRSAAPSSGGGFHGGGHR